jgi:hypothetical protein
MIKKLQQRLFLNNMENSQIIKVWEIILKKNYQPVIYYSKALVLYYFWLLVNNKISVEDFYLLKDLY